MSYVFKEITLEISQVFEQVLEATLSGEVQSLDNCHHFFFPAAHFCRRNWGDWVPGQKLFCIHFVVLWRGHQQLLCHVSLPWLCDTCFSSLVGVECHVFRTHFWWFVAQPLVQVGRLKNMTWFRGRNPCTVWGSKLLTIQEWNRKTSNLPPEISGHKLLSSHAFNYVTMPKYFGGTACDARIIDAMDTLTSALNICRLVALSKTQQAWCRCGSAFRVSFR